MLRGSFEQALRPLPSVVKGVQACRLPGLECLKRCAAASSRHSGHCPLLLRAFKPAECLKRCAAASTRHSGHCPLLFKAFKPAVCQASNASNAARQLRAGTQVARLWPQILRSFVLQDSIDWFRCENLSRKAYKHIITSYVYIYICISAPLKGGRRHQGVSPFYI